MRQRWLFLACVVGALSAWVPEAGAAIGQPVPNALTIQGELRDVLGAPRSGTFDLTVRLYATSTCSGGAGCLLSPGAYTFTGVPVVGGRFAVDLQARQVFRNQSQVWVEFQVGADTPLARSAVTSVGFAVQANHAEETHIATERLECAGCVTANELADNSLTDADFASNAAITWDKLAGVAKDVHVHSEFVIATTPATPQDAGFSISGAMSAMGFIDKNATAYFVDPSEPALSAQFAGKVSIGYTAAPPGLLGVGTNFGVDASGNMKVRGVSYTWPTVQGAGILKDLAGNGTLAWSSAFPSLSSNGVLAKTSGGPWAGRTITGTGGISVDNGDGVNGNPTIGIAADAMLSGTAGVVLPTGDSTRPTGVPGGTVRFNSTGRVIEYFDGSRWRTVMSKALVAAAFPTGMIAAFGGDPAQGATVPPAGWLTCDSLTNPVSRLAPNNALFNVIGTRWGRGNGTNTFNLPDLHGRFARGWDPSAVVDADAASRFALYAGGEVGNKIGTYQGTAIQKHKHDGTGNFNNLNSAVGESRPVNAYVYFVIKR